MLIQININHSIVYHKALAKLVSGEVATALKRFYDHIAMLEVKLSEADAQQIEQNQINCVMEAHLENHQTISVTHQAPSLSQAVDGAVDKVTKLIETTLWEHSDKKSHWNKQLPLEKTLSVQS